MPGLFTPGRDDHGRKKAATKKRDPLANLTETEREALDYSVFRWTQPKKEEGS